MNALPWPHRLPLITEINITEFGSCRKQREVLVDKSQLKKLINRLHIPPYLFLSREDYDDVRHAGKSDFRSVLLYPSYVIQCERLKKILIFFLA